MKKIFAKFALSIALISIALSINIGLANAGNEPVGETKSPVQILKEVGEKVKTTDGKQIIPNFDSTGQHPDAPANYEAGVGAATSPIYFALDIFRYAISGIAFVVVIIAAIKLVSTSSEEDAGKAKQSLIFGIIGLLIVQLADPIVKKMFFGEQGEAFEDIATAQLYAEGTVSYLRGIIGFIHLFLGSTAVLILIIRGFALVTSGGDEEQLTKAKKHVLYAIVGLGVVGLSEVVVRGFVFPDAGNKLPDTALGKALIVSITNYLSGFVAIISFLMLFYAGYQYVVSGGEEEVNEKVKKTVMGAAIGLLLSLAAFAIVNTFVTIGDQKLPATQQPETPQAEIIQ